MDAATIQTVIIASSVVFSALFVVNKAYTQFQILIRDNVAQKTELEAIREENREILNNQASNERVTAELNRKIDKLETTNRDLVTRLNHIENKVNHLH